MSNTKEFYGARTAYYAARTMEHSPTGIHDRCELASEAPATWGLSPEVSGVETPRRASMNDMQLLQYGPCSARCVVADHAG